MKLIVRPATRPLAGTLRPPGDKSISHRAAILGGLAPGETRIEGFLEAEDTLATLAAMERLGARVSRNGDRIEIGGGSLRAGDRKLDLGNSGTGMRLLAGAVCGHPALRGATLRLVGDESLSRRPMDRIVVPLTEMGADISSRDGRAPLVIVPRQLSGIDYRSPVASAQIKSAVLLAGLFADGETRVVEPGTSRDHTERMLPAFGVDPRTDEGEVAIDGPARLKPASVRVPGDLSSAAFAIAAASLVPGSRLRVESVGLNPTRDGFLRIVERMDGRIGANDCVAAFGSEPIANLDVVAPTRLRGVAVPPEWVPLAIDEFPLVMALAAVADGETGISGAAELRVKESDRLAAMVRQLRRLGVAADERSDGAVIRGGTVRGGQVDAEGDHRIAMSLAVLGLVADGPLEIAGAEWIRTSYPSFVDHLRALGADLEWQ